MGHNGRRVNPKLDPPSDKDFFGPPFPADYPSDENPKAPRGESRNGKDNPYPSVKDPGEYEKDYVKDENNDGGEWNAQMEYDAIRTKIKEKEADAKMAEGEEKAKEQEVVAAEDKVKEAEEKLKTAEKREAEAAAEAAKVQKLENQSEEEIQKTANATIKEANDIKDCAKELEAEGLWEAGHPLPLVISKIESVSGLKQFDGILAESDGIMVARGDLGVEIPIQQVTNAQKEMVAKCNAAGKPVIVATQMLESMAKNPRPTRAEVADVTNAIYDGADCVMLSGETAKGKYPVQVVQTMNEIIASAEHFTKHSMPGPNLAARQRFVDGQAEREDAGVDSAVAKAAVTAAEERDAAVIVVLTSQGNLPRMISAYRPNVPILAFCPSAKVARQLIVHRGIHPIHIDDMLADVPEVKRPARAIQYAKQFGMVQEGQNVVVVTRETACDELTTDFASMKIATVP